MNSMALPIPPKEAIFYEDDYVYACLASHPLADGHSVVVWKEHKQDLSELNKTEYTHLMNVVDQVRNALISTLAVEKVYLMYLDEVKHVHWHLIPAHNHDGLNVLQHKPAELKDFSLAEKIRTELV